MSFEWQDALALSGVVAAGVNGGVLFGFSSFVMPALSRLPAPDGVSAMQAINRAAPNPLFMAALFGAVGVGVPLVASAVGRLDEADARYQLAAMILSATTVVITMAFHVPRNNALDALDPTASGTAAEWARYLTAWTRGNHVRTLTSLASAASYAMALRSR